MKQRRPWDWMYQTKNWKLRRAYQLRQQPLCAHCLKDGYIKQANVVHHIEPHRGNWTSFCNGELESLCKSCHDVHTDTVERTGVAKPRSRIGMDGWIE